MSAPDPHLVLLLGAGGISPDAALASARRVTSEISVVWYQGGPSAAAAQALRTAWSADCTGEWLTVADHLTVPDLLAELHARRPVHGVATFGEPLIVAQAEAQRRLGLPGNPPEAVRTAQSKLAQRRRLREAGVERIRFREVTGEADLAEAAAEVGFPAVLKPVHGAASFLVAKVHDEAELRERLRAALDAYRTSPLFDPEPRFVLEQLLVGDDWYGRPGFGDYVSVESLVEDGRVRHVAITDKLPLDAFVETGHLMPTSLPEERRRQVLEHAGRVIAAMGIRWGATHLELKLTPDGPACIELNARLGGPIGHLLRACADTDIAADVVRLALGRPAEGDYRAVRHALYRSVPPPAEAVTLVRQTPREELLAAFPELVFCKTRFAPGAELHPDRPYGVLTFLLAGEDPAHCAALAERVLAAHRAEYAPLG
ncbi:ATP-grasp domain-containing protein [Kitasatospora sp. SolWspMP-SS2h]|uniref:ATP-grasp domain-containing protein n=1 Tax=Kitasatospora sp. SolWspMP-SS2h TaxID=1305729 RepID=UPI000DB8FC2A|nr:ATP-grasp domain-containing protein [Kitasatospora sp. SolWspMP-SS2h]RAJ35256.1 ATP-grasp domain-containing protein [Kitasatospora sp. SolWspMP-SS2h]